jgi:hypothetical protein
VVPLPPLLANDARSERRRKEQPSRAPDLERRQPEWPEDNPSPAAPLPLWLQAIKTLGTTGAIAVFLVWVGSNEVPKISRNTEVTLAAIARLEVLYQAQKEQLEANHRMLQRICSLLSKTDNERAQCFEK